VVKGSSVNAVFRYLQSHLEAGTVVELSDGQLLEHFVARREGAFLEALVSRHGSMVWGVCGRVLRDHHDAEDAFQATFLVLARRADSIMPREKVGNWLYGVAYQTAMKARATRAKRRMREDHVPDAPEPVAVPHVVPDDLAELLDHELSRLPDKYRTPIVLCELINDDDTVVTQVGIETLPGSTVELFSNDKRVRSILTTNFPNRPNGPSSMQVILFADQVEPKKGSTNVVKFGHGSE
jgi:RNA polymerase sigma factor (sigma-70 family)